MKNNLITYTFLEDESGKINKIKTEYEFEENCWIIPNKVTINTAIKIAKILKNKYYNKKQWVVSWNNKNIKIKFVEVGNEMEHF